ncbi:hypothetical protein EJD97_006241, partial [Solanum chilense]
WKSVKTRLGRHTSRRIVMVMTDHHGFRRPILVQYLLLLSSLHSMVDMMDRHRHNGPSRVSVPKHLNSLNLGTGLFSDLHDEPAGQTFMSTMVCHTLRNPILGQNSPSSFRIYTTMPPTNRHEH